MASVIRLTEADSTIILGANLLGSPLLIASAQRTHQELLAIAANRLGKVSILTLIALQACVAGTTHALSTDGVTIQARATFTTSALGTVGEAIIAVNALVAIGTKIAEFTAAWGKAGVVLATDAVTGAWDTVWPARVAFGATVTKSAGELWLALALACVLGTVAGGAFAGTLAFDAGACAVEGCAEGSVVAEGAAFTVNAFRVVLYKLTDNLKKLENNKYCH